VSLQNPDPAAQPDAPGLGRSVAVTTGALVAGRVLALLAGIALVGLASRYLGVSNYGALTAGMAYASLFAILTDLGLSAVATREIARHPDRERLVLEAVVGVGMLLAIAAAVLGLVLMEAVYGGARNAATRQAIVILLVQVLVAPIVGATRAFFTVHQRGYLIAIGDVTLAFAMALFTAIAVTAQLGYRGVIIGIASGYVAQAAVMAGVSRRAGARLTPGVRGGRRLVRAALPVGGTFLLNYLYFRLDILLLSWLRTDVAVARYGLAYRVLEGLMVLPSYVMLALFPAIARAENNRPQLAATVGVALAGLEAAAVGFAALMATFSPEIVVVLGGAKYAPAGPALAILSLALAISYVNGVFGNALLALGRQRALMLITAGPLLVNLIANLLLIPPLGVEGAAIAVVLSEIVGLLGVRTYYIRLMGAPLAPRHGRILAAATVLVGVAVLKFALIPHGVPLLVTVVGGLGGGVLYAAALLRLGALPSEIRDQIPLPPWLTQTRAPR
jgi:O-antigen/teichoic acid export membrane protein